MAENTQKLNFDARTAANRIAKIIGGLVQQRDESNELISRIMADPRSSDAWKHEREAEILSKLDNEIDSAADELLALGDLIEKVADEAKPTEEFDVKTSGELFAYHLKLINQFGKKLPDQVQINIVRAWEYQPSARTMLRVVFEQRSCMAGILALDEMERKLDAAGHGAHDANDGLWFALRRRDIDSLSRIPERFIAVADYVERVKRNGQAPSAPKKAVEPEEPGTEAGTEELPALVNE